jgi:superfamily II DNA or RNA helicase
MENEWHYSLNHNSICKIVDTQVLWGNISYKVWLPCENKLDFVPEANIQLLDQAHIYSTDKIAYITAAARIAEVLTQNILLAPIESSIIPLPHQIYTLKRAISEDTIRYLMCDEVGLGKTIEAGLIMRELKIRGLVDRTLVVAPKGLVAQWSSEMHNRFNEDFQTLIPGDFRFYKNLYKEENVWANFKQVICPMDSVKPLDSRRGWSEEQVMKYNSERFDDLMSAGWDLIIVDEAHRLGGATDQIARFKLGLGLAKTSPYLLLLSATPHQGKTDAFYRILSLLDKKQFPDVSSIQVDKVQPYVIRTEKRQAIDVEGKPLFKPRRTQLEVVSWNQKYSEQRLLYEAVTDYVRNGYNQAVREKRNYIGFLMLLMQRLVASSTMAINKTLERRLDMLDAPEEQLILFPSSIEDDWADMDGQEQLETVMKYRLRALKSERSQVNLLLDMARHCCETSSDAKAEFLLDWIFRLQQEENDPDLKILIFTEFVPTQQMLEYYFSERGFSVVCLNGSMTIDQRVCAQETFAKEARLMISTDAGGEGLNLQFCHVVINYDIPWNPMRLEQRIGRVDRIGQKHIVRAINLVLDGSVEYRVLKVLEDKLAVILEDFGVDKTSDVLDSAEADMVFDQLYKEAILHPEGIESAVDSAISQVKDQAEELKSGLSLLTTANALDSREIQDIFMHPLPHWIERMTISYIRAYGGQVERDNGSWNLKWPDGTQSDQVVFTMDEMDGISGAKYLNLNQPQVRGLISQLSRSVPGLPIPIVRIHNMPTNIVGIWALLQIGVYAGDWINKKTLAIFIHDDGRILLPTARHIWDLVLSTDVRIQDYLGESDSISIGNEIMKQAEIYGENIYQDLLANHKKQLDREIAKGEYSFAARENAINRIGLTTVRNRRIEQLEQEKRTWSEKLAEKAQVHPEMIPLLILRVLGE